MANKRMIASDIWRDDYVCTLDYFKRLLWIGIIVTCADDQGRIQDRAGFIASDIFPGEGISIEKMEDALREFAAEKKIIRYSSGKVNLIQVVHWWEYQSPSWAMASKYPAPDGWTDRIKMHAKDNKVQMINWDQEGGFQGDVHHVPTSLPSPLPTPLPTRLHTDVPTGIDELRIDEKSRDERSREIPTEPEQKTDAAAPAPLVVNSFQTGDPFYLRVWSRVTGMAAIPGGEIEKVLNALDGLRGQYPNENQLVAYLQRYYDDWQKRKRKDGRPYSRSNCAWVYDLAVAGDPVKADLDHVQLARADPNCPICLGNGWVRSDIDDIHDPKFGKMIQCSCVK